MNDDRPASRVVPAVHGTREVSPDPAHEAGLAAFLRAGHSNDELAGLYDRFRSGSGSFDYMMRRVLWKAMARAVGDGLTVEPDVAFKHLETVQIGRGVFVGRQAFIQGRFDGSCSIGDHTWIGPQSYFDARDLVIEDYVGWGPGARVLGSTHVGLPLDVPVIATALDIRPVRIRSGADVGVGAVILPGVTVGQGSMVGAGSVVTRDVPPYAIVAGIPARLLRHRRDVAAAALEDSAGA